jgi:hypothetical protein
MSNRTYDNSIRILRTELERLRKVETNYKKLVSFSRSSLHKLKRHEDSTLMNDAETSREWSILRTELEDKLAELKVNELNLN